MDAVCGSIAPTASERLQTLICCVNVLLSGKLDSHITPWFCSAPLIALIKPGGGFCPITVGETPCRLASKMCCFAVLSILPDLFLPSGQVGVSIPGGLEVAVHSLHTVLSTIGGYVKCF